MQLEFTVSFQYISIISNMRELRAASFTRNVISTRLSRLRDIQSELDRNVRMPPSSEKQYTLLCSRNLPTMDLTSILSLKPLDVYKIQEERHPAGL